MPTPTAFSSAAAGRDLLQHALDWALSTRPLPDEPALAAHVAAARTQAQQTVSVAQRDQLRRLMEHSKRDLAQAQQDLTHAQADVEHEQTRVAAAEQAFFQSETGQTLHNSITAETAAGETARAAFAERMARLSARAERLNRERAPWVQALAWAHAQDYVRQSAAIDDHMRVHFAQAPRGLGARVRALACQLLGVQILAMTQARKQVLLNQDPTAQRDGLVQRLEVALAKMRDAEPAVVRARRRLATAQHLVQQAQQRCEAHVQDIRLQERALHTLVKQVIALPAVRALGKTLLADPAPPTGRRRAEQAASAQPAPPDDLTWMLTWMGSLDTPPVSSSLAGQLLHQWNQGLTTDIGGDRFHPGGHVGGGAFDSHDRSELRSSDDWAAPASGSYSSAHDSSSSYSGSSHDSSSSSSCDSSSSSSSSPSCD